MRRIATAMITLPLLLAAAAPGHAADPRKSRHLWATVNVCDTARNQDSLGIRASMPGSGRRNETMWMRFRVQYFARSEGMWHNFTGKGADSGYVRVGRHARFRARQSGYVFPFQPEAGDRYLLRGSVEFQWRNRRGRPVRRVRELTKAGYPSAVADPKGFSAATCVIRGQRR